MAEAAGHTHCQRPGTISSVLVCQKPVVTPAGGIARGRIFGRVSGVFQAFGLHDRIDFITIWYTVISRIIEQIVYRIPFTCLTSPFPLLWKFVIIMYICVYCN